MRKKKAKEKQMIPEQLERAHRVFREKEFEPIAHRTKRVYQSGDHFEQYMRDLEWCTKKYTSHLFEEPTHD